MTKEKVKKERDWGSIKLYSITFFICAGIIAMAAVSNISKSKWVEEVQKFKYESRNHVEGEIKYKEISPVGGDHSPIWQNCGFYSTPIDNGLGVHSLEHGAVWITYNPSISEKDREVLSKYSLLNPYVLISPIVALEGKITLSAWNNQLSVDSVKDERISKFINYFANGPQTPEPGAACSGGFGTPEFSN